MKILSRGNCYANHFMRTSRIISKIKEMESAFNQGADQKRVEILGYKVSEEFFRSLESNGWIY